MIKRNNKKGFTIVELVIVIAVIAILAAVLIPTFAGIINKANQSADQQAVANMNKLLAIEEKPENVDGVIEILIANDYAGDLTTYYKNYSLAWVAEDNVIVLVENDAIVYPEKYVGKTFEKINPMATDAEALVGGLTDGKVVYVSEEITTDKIYKDAAGTYTIKLNGNAIALNGNASDSTNKIGAFGKGVEIKVSNGIIDGSEIVVPTTDTKAVVVHSKYGATVELSNIQIIAPNNANPIQCYGATMVLNNVTVAQTGDNDKGYYNSAIQIVDGYGENDQYRSHLTVNGGVYTGTIALQMSLPGGTVVINNGIFTGEEAIHMDSNGTSYPEHAHSITINDGTFTGKIHAGVGSTIEINGGTFSINPSTDITGGGTVTINGEVVDNGNGTWTVK